MSGIVDSFFDFSSLLIHLCAVEERLSIVALYNVEIKSALNHSLFFTALWKFCFFQQVFVKLSQFELVDEWD